LCSSFRESLVSFLFPPSAIALALSLRLPLLFRFFPLRVFLLLLAPPFSFCRRYVDACLPSYFYSILIIAVPSRQGIRVYPPGDDFFPKMANE
jgi:hypothetical protein